MNSPLVSIIIPTYNRAHLIGETLDSVLAQTYTNWECIVVDDGCTDNTNLVISKYISKDSRFQYHHRPNYKQKGPSSCRNYGFELSKGEYLTWFDDDDVMMPNALEKRINLFDADADTDVVICKLIYYNFEANIVINETNIISDKTIEDYLIGNVTYFVSGPIWKRDFLVQQNYLFDENITNLDDWDFNLRMLYAEPSIILVNEALIKYRMHNNSLSLQILQLNFLEIKSEFKARMKHLWLLRFEKDIDSKQYRKFMIGRNKSFLREALIVNNEAKFYLFKTLMISQFFLFDIVDMVKSMLGFTSYSIIKKGYFFFK